MVCYRVGCIACIFVYFLFFFFFKQKTAYEMRISDWSSDVCSSDLMGHAFQDTIMDTLIRYRRMQGNNTLWQPGTDHAGIATQKIGRASCRERVCQYV